VSAFIPDASYALTWCFADRCTPATDETLKRLESAVDHAMVSPIWAQNLPLATKDHGLKEAAESYGVIVMVP
jgi:hypothetical protein